ncbi:MAG TPA: MerR family transcriptional regulator [Bacteroidetes bacterium]|nr:MerR family transcriptional regulator [Bacteroidota bacterium]
MPEKIYFKIGDVAKRFGVAPSLIRYWEQEFPFIKPKKTEKGTRFFTRKDMDHFEIVYHLVKEKGMTIQGARDFIKNKKEGKMLEHLEVINTLKRTRLLLSDVKNILENRNAGETKLSDTGE